MEIEIYSTSTGSYDDDDVYTLVFDEQEGSIYVEYYWSYWRPSGPNTDTRRLELNELKHEKPHVYKKMVALLKARLFSNEKVSSSAQSSSA